MVHYINVVYTHNILLSNVHCGTLLLLWTWIQTLRQALTHALIGSAGAMGVMWLRHVPGAHGDGELDICTTCICHWCCITKHANLHWFWMSNHLFNKCGTGVGLRPLLCGQAASCPGPYLDGGKRPPRRGQAWVMVGTTLKRVVACDRYRAWHGICGICTCCVSSQWWHFLMLYV